MEDIERKISFDLSNEPIKLPGSPFWNVFRRFGRDELIAFFINVIGTFIVGIFTAVPFILAFAGPIIEKIGFFPAHFKEARDVYKTTPEKRRKNISYYYKRAMKGGLTSLIEDILVHDPVYIVLMFGGLLIYPGTPAWLLSIVSFIIAVFVVAFLEVMVTEIRYRNFKKRMKREGFEFEEYYETRFFIRLDKKPQKILEELSKEFKLRILPKLMYDDIYTDHEFSKYSGRIPKVRLRKRTRSSKKMKKFMQTIQVVYTRPRENMGKTPEQYRFFPIKKEKLYYVFKNKMPKKIEEIENVKIKNFLIKNKCKKNLSRIQFERYLARSKDLLISVDKVSTKKGYTVLELKTHKNFKLLIKAMRHVMRELPVMQTTKGKIDIVLFDKEN